MYVIKKVDPLSVAKMSAILAIIIGLVPMIIMFIVGLVFGSIASGFGMFDYYSFQYIFLPLIIGPIIAIIVGFVGGLIYAWLYNLIADKFGGIKMEIVLEQQDQPQPPVEQ